MLRRRILRTAILVGILVVLAAVSLSFKEIHLLGLDRGADGPLGLTLGLDLQGGSYLKYQANFPDEIEFSFTNQPGDVSVELVAVEATLIGYTGVSVEAGENDNSFTILVAEVTEEDEADIRAALERESSIVDFQATFPDDAPAQFDVTFDPILRGPIQRLDILGALASIDSRAAITSFRDNSYTIQLPNTDLDEETQEQVETALSALAPIDDDGIIFRPGKKATEDDLKGVVDTINRRINALGTTEPTVQRLGDDKVIVQLPGVEDLEEAKELIGQTAQLVFRERTCETIACINFTEDPVRAGSEEGLTGEDLADAFSDRDSAGLPVVSLRFDGRGTKLFADLTRRIQNDDFKRIAFYLDNEEILAPVAQSYIPDGRTIIRGSFTVEETRRLAVQLKSGAIPVPLTPIAETTVDATLGEDSLDKNLKAGLVGLGLVLIFMVAYYRAPGLVAAAALVIYAVLLMAIFKMMPVTLTLSGIAGLILSVGMAVDANVLIFERVKEELRTGRTLSSSMDVGFRRAWTAIFDGNVSTLITCGILWWLGSRLGAPQVTGFALTLGIGVAVSMFTAVTVSRNLLQLLALSRIGQRTNLFTPEGIRRPASVGGGED